MKIIELDGKIMNTYDVKIQFIKTYTIKATDHNSAYKLAESVGEKMIAENNIDSKDMVLGGITTISLKDNTMHIRSICEFK
jgi:propanediol dehydratase large subunit